MTGHGKQIEQRLTELGITLPQAAPPAANYMSSVQIGSMLYISGQLPAGEGKVGHFGRLGEDLDVEAGKEAARSCAISLLAVVKQSLGSFDRLDRFVKLTGFVNAAPSFTDMPQVINGASDFLVEAMGERGRHSRSAVGVSSLPFGVAVEIEAIVAVL